MGNRLSGKLLPSVGVVLILSSGTTVSSIEMAAVAFLLWLNQDLATITLDRIFDGIVFLGFTAIVLAFYPFTDQSEILKSGISWGALTSLGLFAVLIALLVGFQYALKKEYAVLHFILRWLPARLGKFVETFFQFFIEGTILPKQLWRKGVTLLASIIIKLVAVAHFFWVGLAFDVFLKPMDYLFLLVFLGYIVFLASMIRIAGSFTTGAVFVLKGFGIEVETALAMTILLQTITQLTIGTTGFLALWIQGIKLKDLSTFKEVTPTHNSEKQP